MSEEQQQTQLKPGDKVAPGKVVSKDGKSIEESSSKKLLRAGKNVGEAYLELKTGGMLGKGGVGKPGGPTGGPTGSPGVPKAGGPTGSPAGGPTGGPGFGNAGGPGFGKAGGQGFGNPSVPSMGKGNGQGIGDIPNSPGMSKGNGQGIGDIPEGMGKGDGQGIGDIPEGMGKGDGQGNGDISEGMGKDDVGGSSPMQQPKGYGSGNQKSLNSNPSGGNQQMNPKQVIGKVANDVGDKIADKIDEDPVAKKVADDLEDVSDTVNNAMDAYKKAKSGDIKGAKESAKNAKKSAGKAVRKVAIRAILGLIAAILLPFLFLVLIVVVIILPFVAGFKALADFIGGDEYDAIASEYGLETIAEAGSDSTPEAVKAVVGSIPDFETLSEARKSLIIAAIDAVGAPYKEGGLPSTGDFGELYTGLSGVGLYRWLIMRVFGHDFPMSTIDDLVYDSETGDGFQYYDNVQGTPGDAYVDENNDIAIYLGNDQWLHADITPTDGTEDSTAKKEGTFIIGYYFDSVQYVEKYVKLDQE